MSDEKLYDEEAPAAPADDAAPEVEEEAPPEQAVAPPAAAFEPKPSMAAVAGIPLNEAQFPLFIVLVASIVLIIALGAHYEWKDYVSNNISLALLFSLTEHLTFSRTLLIFISYNDNSLSLIPITGSEQLRRLHHLHRFHCHDPLLLRTTLDQGERGFV